MVVDGFYRDPLVEPPVPYDLRLVRLETDLPDTSRSGSPGVPATPKASLEFRPLVEFL